MVDDVGAAGQGPQPGASAQGGYLLSGIEDKNLDSPKIVQIEWTGVKYAYDIQTDLGTIPSV